MVLATNKLFGVNSPQLLHLHLSCQCMPAGSSTAIFEILSTLNFTFKTNFCVQGDAGKLNVQLVIVYHVVVTYWHCLV